MGCKGDNMKTIYALEFNSNYIPGTQTLVLCETQELARIALAAQKSKVCQRNVSVHESTEDKFTYTFGWEERGGTFRIVPKDVVANLGDLPQ